MSKPSGIIKLIHRAPIDITYQHQIDFKSPSEQMSYWDSKTKYTLRDYTYIRRERRSVKVNKSLDDLEGINYLAYQARSETGTKWYYAFVLDREYINEETTTLTFEIDVFQSFMFDYSFKPSYVSQAHVDRWDANHFPIYSRTEEGLNYGTEYVTESAFRMESSYHPHGFYLVYLAGVNKPVPEGETSLVFNWEGVEHVTEVANNPIPYTILAFPQMTNPQDHKYVIGYDDGERVQAVADMRELNIFMANSALGNYIKQIVYLPYSFLPYTARSASSGETEGAGVDVIFRFTGEEIRTSNVSISSGTRTLHAIKLSVLYEFVDTFASLPIFEGLEEKMPSEEMWSALKSSPRKTERDRRYESKLLCYPYRYNLFTDWQSTPCLVKNEYLTGEKITVKGSIGLGFNTPRRWWIEGYRKDPEGREVSISQSLPFEQSVISDAYYTYMLQNKNQILANVANAKLTAETSVLTGAFNGAVGGASVGGAWGAVGGAITGGAGSVVNSYVSITNMLRSENAKQADINAMPDSITPSNDVTLAIADKNTFITIYRKAICCEFEEQLAQYWHMFGYKVNRLEVPDLRSRVRYNYIKTIGVNIEGAIESTFLSALKSIFDNGVTIWHYSAEDFNPLDYTYENPEVKLI